jgi:hypothetical protein
MEKKKQLDTIGKENGVNYHFYLKKKKLHGA